MSSLVWTTLASPEEVKALGLNNVLVEGRIVESIYRWEGKVCQEEEWLVQLPQTDDLENRHPYEVPMLVQLVEEPTEFVLLTQQFGDQETPKRLAQDLVRTKLAACCQLTRDSELRIKTLAQLARHIQLENPTQTFFRANPAYEAWIHECLPVSGWTTFVDLMDSILPGKDGVTLVKALLVVLFTLLVVLHSSSLPLHHVYMVTFLTLGLGASAIYTITVARNLSKQE